jgi:hypothetical protein
LLRSRPPFWRDLLGIAQKNLVSAVRRKLRAMLSLRVAFENAPPGAKTYMQYGGMFKKAKVD